jgi:hypothetical protein
LLRAIVCPYSDAFRAVAAFVLVAAFDRSVFPTKLVTNDINELLTRDALARIDNTHAKVFSFIPDGFVGTVLTIIHVHSLC